MPITQISRENVVVDTVAFVAAPEIYFDVTGQPPGAGFEMTIEGRVNVAGGGGGRIQFTGPDDAMIQGHAAIDNGPPQSFSGFGVPIGGGSGAVPNGNHKFEVWAVVLMGSNPGLVQLQIGLNNQPGSASMTLGRTAIQASRESASF